MMVVVGSQRGRMQRSGSDYWGHFMWTELLLLWGRDEGILVILAYGVDQKHGAAAGPHISCSQQINRMIVKGDLTLGLSTQILKDLRDLIVANCEQGFKPNLMMDVKWQWWLARIEQQKCPKLNWGTSTCRSIVPAIWTIWSGACHICKRLKEPGLHSTGFNDSTINQEWWQVGITWGHPFGSCDAIHGLWRGFDIQR